MPSDAALNNDDDYVISLLLKDADANRNRYLTNTLGPLLSKRAADRNVPRPNTRFLRNIIRETDSHNAALQTRGEEESMAKLSELRGGKRKREDVGEDRKDDEAKRRRDDKPGRWASALGGLGERSRQGKDRQGNDPPERYGEPARHIDHDGHRRSGKTGKSDSEQNRRLHIRPRSPSHRKEHHRHSRRDHTPEDRRKHQRRRAPSPLSPGGSASPPKRKSTEDGQTYLEVDSDQDSDPLESIIGPKPPPSILPRGRGAHKSNTMDSRFSTSYNPKEDVDLSDSDYERDDWDMAMEALRDRAKWRARGAERLRDAGFSEEEVRKWEGGGREFVGSGGGGGGGGDVEKGVEDVRWAKEGEGREWDRGKVVKKDGVVAVEATWGRLKGT